MKNLYPMIVLLACTTGVSAGEWTVTTSNAGKYRVKFPGRPVTMTHSEKTFFGKLDHHIQVVYTSQGFFGVHYVDCPDALVEGDGRLALEGVALGWKAMLSNNARVVEEKLITLNNHPGKLMVLEKNVAGRKVRAYCRAYLVNSRLYQLIAIDNGGLQTADVDRFTSSFQLLKP